MCKRTNSSSVVTLLFDPKPVCSLPHGRFWMWRRRMDTSYEDWLQKGAVDFFFHHFLVIHYLYSLKYSYFNVTRFLSTQFYLLLSKILFLKKCFDMPSLVHYVVKLNVAKNILKTQWISQQTPKISEFGVSLHIYIYIYICQSSTPYLAAVLCFWPALESVISPFFESSVWILIFYSPLPHEEACI